MSIQRNVFLLRYEDLCANSTESLQRICDFLEVSYEERMHAFKAHKGHLLMGNHMMYDSNQGVTEDLRWRDALSTEEKLLFQREDLVQAYAHIGYDLTIDT